MVAVSERIQALVRPLDTATYYGSGQFAVIMMQPSIDHCDAECYARIYDGLRLKSYGTSAGYQPVEIAMSLCAGTAETGPPNAARMIETAMDGLEASHRNECIIVNRIS